MSEEIKDEPTTCYSPEPETPLEIAPDTDVSLETVEVVPAQEDTAAGISNRRANFAAPESGDGKKRSTGGFGGSGGIDSLGGGRLP
jgi:hypothetical protein